MKIKDAIKKLNAMDELEDKIETKGLNEKELEEAFMEAVESIDSDVLETKENEDIVEFYNALVDRAEAPEAPAKAPAKPEKKAPEKKAPEKKAPEKPEKKAPAKPEKKASAKPEKKADKGDSKIVARTVIAEAVKNNKYTFDELVKNLAKSGIAEKTVKLYIGAWKRGDRVPFGKSAVAENAKTNILSFVS